MTQKIETIRQMPPAEKIRTFDEVASLLGALGRIGVVAIAPGVFDVVHRGHVHFLRAARALDPQRSIVVAPIEGDESVRLQEGVARPINTAEERMDMLAEFSSVDYVCTFPDTPRYDRPEDFAMRYRALRQGVLVVPAWDEFRGLKQDQATEAGMGMAVVSYPHFRNSTTEMLRSVGFRE